MTYRFYLQTFLLLAVFFLQCKKEENDLSSTEIVVEFGIEQSYNDLYVNTPLNFTNYSSLADKYIWNFGDGSNLSFEKRPTHTYTDPGTYTVSLTIQKGIKMISITKTIVIKKAITFVTNINTIPGPGEILGSVVPHSNGYYVLGNLAKYGIHTFSFETSSCYSLGLDGAIKQSVTFPDIDNIWDAKIDNNGNIVACGVQKNNGVQTGCVVKISPSLNVIVKESLGTAEASLTELVINSNNESIVVGSKFGKLWILKLSSLGYVSWEKEYIDIKASGNIKVAKRSNDNFLVYYDIVENQVPGFIVFDVAPNGDVVNTYKTLLSSMSNYVNQIISTQDNGWIALKSTRTGTVENIEVEKFSSAGASEWVKTVTSATSWLEPGPFCDTRDGNYFLAYSVSGVLHEVKLDQQGNTIWKRTLLTDKVYRCKDTHQTKDNGFIIGTTRDDGPVGDIMIIKTNSEGKLD